MKVSELIKELKKMDPDACVYFEGGGGEEDEPSGFDVHDVVTIKDYNNSLPEGFEVDEEQLEDGGVIILGNFQAAGLVIEYPDEDEEESDDDEEEESEDDEDEDEEN